MLDNKQKKLLFLGISLVLLFSIFSIAVLPTINSEQQFADGDNAGASADVAPAYHSNVCIGYNKFLGYNQDGSLRYASNEEIDCSHNVLFKNGQNMTRNLLGIGGNSILNISLANASADVDTPSANATEAYTPYAGCGLLSTAGTYGTNPVSPGNWSVFATFTSTCNNVVTNVTRLLNASGSNFAGNAFNFVNLSNNDQLTVNWTIFIT